VADDDLETFSCGGFLVQLEHDLLVEVHPPGGSLSEEVCEQSEVQGDGPEVGSELFLLGDRTDDVAVLDQLFLVALEVDVHGVLQVVSQTHFHLGYRKITIIQCFVKRKCDPI